MGIINNTHKYVLIFIKDNIFPLTTIMLFHKSAYKIPINKCYLNIIVAVNLKSKWLKKHLSHFEAIFQLELDSHHLIHKILSIYWCFSLCCKLRYLLGVLYYMCRTDVIACPKILKKVSVNLPSKIHHFRDTGWCCNLIKKSFFCNRLS